MLSNSTEEIWKEIEGYPGYRVSTLGRVQTKRHKNGLPAPNWRDMTPVLDGHGYPQVRLYRHGDAPRWFFVSRLVLLTFVGEPPTSSHVARHVTDPDPCNCHLENLAWGTQSQNCRDKETHGTAQKLESHPRAKLTVKQVLEMRRRVSNGETVASVARDFAPIGYNTILSAVRGKSWPGIMHDSCSEKTKTDDNR